MAKSKDQKKDMVSMYKQKLEQSNAVVLISTTGLTAANVSELKMKALGLGSSYHVVKNTLFSLALKEVGMPELETLKGGTHSALFISTDIAGGAKLLKDYMKTFKDKIIVKGGLLDGQELSVQQVNDLADMPTKQQSIAMIAYLLTNPIAGVANVLEDSVRSVAIIIDLAFKE